MLRSERWIKNKLKHLRRDLRYLRGPIRRCPVDITETVVQFWVQGGGGGGRGRGRRRGGWDLSHKHLRGWAVLELHLVRLVVRGHGLHGDMDKQRCDGNVGKRIFSLMDNSRIRVMLKHGYDGGS